MRCKYVGQKWQKSMWFLVILAGERLKALTNNFTRKDWFVGLSKMTLLPVESASSMKNFRQPPVFITVENEKTKSRWHLYASDKVWKNLEGVVHGLRSWLIKMQSLLNTENHGIDHYLTKTLFSKKRKILSKAWDYLWVTSQTPGQPSDN